MKQITTLLCFAFLLAMPTLEAHALSRTERLQRMRARVQERREVRQERWRLILEAASQRRVERLARRDAGSSRRTRSAQARKQTVRERVRLIRSSKVIQSTNQRVNLPVRQAGESTTKPVNPRFLIPDVVDDDANLLPNQKHTPTNPLPNLNGSSHFLVLGEKHPVMGSVKLNPVDEPVEIRSIEVRLTSEVSSIAGFEVLDEFGYVLGSAALDLVASAGRNVYTLDLNPDVAYFIDQDEEVILAVRPRTKENDEGGSSGQTAKLSAIVITATGRWTSKNQLVSTSGPDFQSHETALATITTIRNADRTSGAFAVGSNKRLGKFLFESRSSNDASADPRLTQISFDVSAPSEVNLSNPVLVDVESGLTHSCSIGSSVITCSSIPESLGSLQAPRTLAVNADVSLVGNHPNPFLMIEINTAGRPASSGDITWTDGVSSFTWVPFDSPVTQGTSYD